MTIIAKNHHGLYLESSDVERIYDAVAERRSHDEILEMMHDTFSSFMEMRPPVLAKRVAALVAPEGAVNG